MGARACAHAFCCLLLPIEHRNLGDGPAVVWAGDFKLHHGDGIRGAAHDAEATTNTFLLVDDHIGTTNPIFGAKMHGITLDYA